MTETSAPTFLDRVRAAGRATGLNQGLRSYIAETWKAVGDGTEAVAAIVTGKPLATARAALVRGAADAGDAARAIPPDAGSDAARRKNLRRMLHLAWAAAELDRHTMQPTASEITAAADADRNEIAEAFQSWANHHSPEHRLRELADRDPYIDNRFQKLGFDLTPL